MSAVQQESKSRFNPASGVSEKVLNFRESLNALGAQSLPNGLSIFNNVNVLDIGKKLTSAGAH